MMLAVFGQTHRDHRAADDRGPELVQLPERLPQHFTVVHSRRHHDLRVELDPVVGEVPQLREDLRRGRIAQQITANRRVRRVHRDVQRGEPVFDDPAHVLRLEIRQRGEVAVAEGEAVVIVPDVQDVTQAVGKPVHEAEIAAVGASPDARRLERNADRLAERALDVELDLFAAGTAHVQQEVLFGREEFPVQEVLELLPVDREQLGPGLQPELFADRFRLYRRHLDHGHQSCRAAKDRPSGR